ncbi:MAG: hypothetical protein KUF72_05265 [Candidatus Thiodiazotropha sp. (ex Ctena orbiculata)]|nr:hypothetical protein [Candidatus Thiodiazotropha taylori]
MNNFTANERQSPRNDAIEMSSFLNPFAFIGGDSLPFAAETQNSQITQYQITHIVSEEVSP